MLFTINCCDMCGCVGHYDGADDDVSISIGIFLVKYIFLLNK